MTLLLRGFFYFYFYATFRIYLQPKHGPADTPCGGDHRNELMPVAQATSAEFFCKFRVSGPTGGTDADSSEP